MASEELILDLTPRLKGFKSNLFTEDCLFVGVDPDPVQKMEYPGLGVVENHWNGKKTNNKTEIIIKNNDAYSIFILIFIN